MKIIDLLNKIANGEEVPKKIKIKNEIWIYDEIDYRASDDRGYLFEVHTRTNCQDLNEEIEILEEKEICYKCHKYPAEYNQTYCEFCLGISKLEEKKIPEKLNLDTYATIGTEVDKDVIVKINEIIDYLKSKGE